MWFEIANSHDAAVLRIMEETGLDAPAAQRLWERCRGNVPRAVRVFQAGIPAQPLTDRRRKIADAVRRRIAA
jgi:hypothetical protein